jgi:Transglycosylase SLT domain
MTVLVNEVNTSTMLLQSLKTMSRDIRDGIIAVTHNALALIGFAVLLLALLAFGKPDARRSVELEALSWLQSRLVSNVNPVEPALELALPTSTTGLMLQAQMDDLPKQQKLVAEWLSKRYRIAPDPMAHMVAAAYDTAGTLKLDPLLVLAVVAIESSFNPFVQSGVGAQGLMQVMSNLHEEKFERFGGTNAAFDPTTSIKVGAVILKEYVSRAGSVEGGLKMYVGAANFETDDGYGHKVISERIRLHDVAAGKRVPLFNAPIAVAVLSAAPLAEKTSYFLPQSHAQQSLLTDAAADVNSAIVANETSKRDVKAATHASDSSQDSKPAAPTSTAKPAVNVDTTINTSAAPAQVSATTASPASATPVATLQIARAL